MWVFCSVYIDMIMKYNIYTVVNKKKEHEHIWNKFSNSEAI